MSLFNVNCNGAADKRKNTLGNLKAGVPFLLDETCHKGVLYIKLEKGFFKDLSGIDYRLKDDMSLVVNPKSGKVRSLPKDVAVRPVIVDADVVLVDPHHPLSHIVYKG